MPLERMGLRCSSVETASVKQGHKDKVKLEKAKWFVGETYANFLDGIRTQASRETYETGLRLYCNKLCMDTDAIIGFARRDNPSGLDQLKSYLRLVKAQIESGQLQPTVIRTYYSGIKLFYGMNDVVFNWMKIEKMFPEITRLEDRGYTKEEINKLLEHADLRATVIILLESSAGLRVGALPDLRVKHITPRYINGKLVAARITTYAGTSAEYIAFCTPECYHAIEKYLEYRRRNYENVTDDSPLIRNTVRQGVPLNALRKTRKLTVGSIETLVHRLVVKAGVRKIDKKRRRYDMKLNHGFRKFFNTQCKEAKIDILHKEWIQGRGFGMDDVYHRPENYEDDLLMDYLKAVNALTFNDAELLKEELKQLKQKTEAEKGLEKQLAKVVEDLEKVKTRLDVAERMKPDSIQKAEG